MKKLTLALSLLIASFGAMAQTEPMTSVFGIELGSNKKQVKDQLMSKQPECKLYSGTDMSLIFEKVKWGAYKTYMVVFQFSDEDRLHTVKILVEPDHCQNVFRLYDEITGVINERYYTTNSKVERYSYPYQKSDKYKYTATMVKNGKVAMQSLWSFDNLKTPDNEDDDNHINVSVTDDCLVAVSYQDGLIIEGVIAKKKQKDSKDY